jgi:hypothetical protein
MRYSIIKKRLFVLKNILLYRTLNTYSRHDNINIPQLSLPKLNWKPSVSWAAVRENALRVLQWLNRAVSETVSKKNSA